MKLLEHLAVDNEPLVYVGRITGPATAGTQAVDITGLLTTSTGVARVPQIIIPVTVGTASTIGVASTPAPTATAVTIITGAANQVFDLFIA